jgi:hypothetical protein
MHRDERLAYFRRALAEMAPVEDGFVVFEDADEPDRVVQVAKPSPGDPPVIEATNDYDDEGAALTAEQSAALTALGFDVTIEPFPQRAVDPAVPPVVADLGGRGVPGAGRDRGLHPPAWSRASRTSRPR